MKFSKKKLFIFLILVFPSLVCFALPENPLSLNFSLGTSAIVYGDEQTKEYKTTLFEENATRFILNSEVSVQLFLDEYISLNLGGIAGFDWFKNSSTNMFLLKYDIFTGIRIFPTAKGFNFGVDYICGSYTNFLKVFENQTSDDEEVYEQKTSKNLVAEWSNGFRIVAEYNFIELASKFTPAIGCYWQNMPRFNGYDNSFVVYLKLSMR